MTLRRTLPFSLVVALLFAAFARAEDRQANPQKAADEMAQAAKNFWAALTPEQQSKAGIKFDDEERLHWEFVPKARKGLTIKDMTSAQRDLAHALLASGLSYKGYMKAVTIMSLDQVLKEMEQGKGPTRDPELYYVTIFGTPGGSDPWAWRVEGHHVSLNFTITGGKATAVGPAFLGANPAEVKDGPRKGLRVLAEEEDLGRQLIKSLTDDQRKTAIFDKTAPKEIITGNQRKAMLLQPAGVGYADLKDEQQSLVRELVADYADRLRGELAAEDVKRIAGAGWDKVQFAWAGGTEPGEPHYYRIQGPTFLIEFDDTQNNANHIHTVWRDLTRDFGEDLLGKHYSESHAEKK
jgi:hypothetical protein